MSEQVVEKKEKDNKKLIIIIIITVAVLIIGGLTTVIVMLLNKGNTTAPVQDSNNNSLIKYEPGVIAIDQNDLQSAYNEAVKKTEDGYITLLFNNWAESEDGVNFACSIGNSDLNKYDMYFDMYLDNTLSQRVFVTGLIPPGSCIQRFKSEVELKPGTYEAVLVLTQVKDDHLTIAAQSSVQVNLVVKG